MDQKIRDAGLLQAKLEDNLKHSLRNNYDFEAKCQEERLELERVASDVRLSLSKAEAEHADLNTKLDNTN